MWGHRKNSQTEFWTSDDGLRFKHRGVSITAKNIGTRNATYTRVYEYPLKRYGSKYIMLYSGFIQKRGDARPPSTREVSRISLTGSLVRRTRTRCAASGSGPAVR